MSRSLKKGPYINERLIKKVQALRPGDRTVIRTWDRAAVISPEMVGFRFGIHDGRKHVEVLAIEDMVGHKLGEFAPTRKFIKHGGRMMREEGRAALTKEAKSTQEVTATEKTEKTEKKEGQ